MGAVRETGRRHLFDFRPAGVDEPWWRAADSPRTTLRSGQKSDGICDRKGIRERQHDLDWQLFRLDFYLVFPRSFDNGNRVLHHGLKNDFTLFL